MIAEPASAPDCHYAGASWQPVTGALSIKDYMLSENLFFFLRYFWHVYITGRILLSLII
jgi:hypothetical protein